MKKRVVIIGPEGTPYAHGFFEFDIFCPKEYPNEPPKVWFKGTDGGTAWINPNLHSDGKGNIA
jgi:ubiquitin-protein ligase